MPQANTLSSRAPSATCTHCNFHTLCLPFGLSNEELQQLDLLVSNRKNVAKGHALYRVGHPFESIYAVRSGFFKTDILFEDGRTQIMSFQMEGDILGLDGLCTSQYSCNAIALENSEVCVIPYAKLENVLHQIRALQHHFNQMMSREIVQDHRTMLLLGTMRAEERLAAFLVNLSKRFSARGFCAHEFHLRMTREEIGNFLGLKLETVSRVFSRFQEEGLIEVQHKHIKIHQLNQLIQMVSP